MLPRDTHCNYPYCGNEIFKNQKYCILHCHQDIATQEDEWYFEKLFLKYLKDKICDYLPRSIGTNLDDYISVSDFFRNNDVIDFLKENYITISDIYFPKFFHLSSLNYLPLCRKIEFSGCHFNQKEIFINGSNVKFYCCTFNCNIEKHFHNNFFKNYDNEIDIFSECLFKDRILFNGINFSEININSLFCNCVFDKNIIIENSTITFDIFRFYHHIGTPTSEKNDVDKFRKIKYLNIRNCKFEKKFILNNFEINELYILDSIFQDKLEIKNSQCKKFEFKNSNVEKVSDFFESHFDRFEMRKSIFRDFAGFENTIFGTKEFGKATFTYVTFMSFANFRGATFNFGLDLSNTNLKESPNFLGINILSDNTNRETFRIIKNSFDKNGNHIEANNYFIQEMKSYKYELKGTKGNFSKKFIVYLNGFISSFGQSYLRPFFILIISIMVYNGLIYGQQFYFVGEDCIFYNFVNNLNNSSRNFLPFSNFLKDRQGIEFISLLFYIWFSILIWQIVVAVKRHTIR
ncbi:hypothetical protein [Moraxella equi]|uniref:Pentapeptide repeat-containing protein n=2 Tax=Moraxella equi TaxID=60442 RepID=A0A378QTU1_9GAMM|nr:hypothetical protein [Moraxella equi]OPH40185.1 hypothetical protein B5J93_00460 [Moraxella equi]STZ04275.1 Uncharacterised protein [Moraxella equi]